MRSYAKEARENFLLVFFGDAVALVSNVGDNVVAFDDDFYLEVEIDDESIAEFEQDEPGEFGGHVHGISEGVANAVFKLMHGAVGSGHADFETASVHIHVGDDEHDDG